MKEVKNRVGAIYTIDATQLRIAKQPLDWQLPLADQSLQEIKDIDMGKHFSVDNL